VSGDLLLAEAGANCHLNTVPGCGFPAPGAEIFFFDPVASFTLAGLTINITKPMILLYLSVIIVVGFFVLVFRRATVVPSRTQGLAEYGYLFVRDGIARDTIGREGDKFVPLLFSFFFLVWMNNLWGIIPFAQIPVSSKFAIPVAFAAIVYLAWVPLGIKRQGAGAFFKNMTMPKDVPKAMYVLLIPIEILSNFIVRPFTHSVRLFANMFAGHMLLATFAIAAWYTFPVDWSQNTGVAAIGLAGSLASSVVYIALTAFEMGIQALQAYVFTLLAAVYLNDAVNAH
jgi:F-type H+-transporting ATPase subunit a